MQNLLIFGVYTHLKGRFWYYHGHVAISSWRQRWIWPFLSVPTLPFFFHLQCSVSCGRGTKQREIACVYQNQTKIEEELCNHLPRPRTEKSCRARGCPAWKANRWREVRTISTGPAVMHAQTPPGAANVGHVHTTHLSNHHSVYSCLEIICGFFECDLNTTDGAVYVAHFEI